MTDAPALMERIVAAIGRLTELGETIADEWTYVHDLETVWAARLRAVAAERGEQAGRPTSELQAAFDRLVAEADSITDPHRAIDWLSTLPQASLVALGETAW
jgi:hypothetical protein